MGIENLYFFIFVFTIVYIQLTFLKICSLVDLNPGPLDSEAAALPVVPQPPLKSL